MRSEVDHPSFICFRFLSCEWHELYEHEPKTYDSKCPKSTLIKWISAISLFIVHLQFAGIIIPGVWSVETSLLFLIAGSLVARSVSDIWMIQSVTMIESTIIAMERDKFKTTLMKYFAALPLVSQSYFHIQNIYVLSNSTENEKKINKKLQNYNSRLRNAMCNFIIE